MILAVVILDLLIIVVMDYLGLLLILIASLVEVPARIELLMF